MRAQVEASSPAAKAALEELLAVARSHGVEVNPRLWLSEHDGQMSVHADVADGETLIRLPEELLVPMDGAEWEVSGRGDLSVVQHNDDATTAQRELADALVAVYNATRKVEWAQVGLPRVALLDVPAALAAIRTLRPGFAAERVSVADAFVQTRVLRWSVGSTEDVANEGRYLIPVIDLMNHHERGAPWRSVDNSLSISVARPAGDSQCFVRYRARQDPLDLALGYGFVDDSCTLARSIPVTVDVAGLGSIEVAGQHRQARNALDPPTVRVEADRLWLSHITFDTRHPDRLEGVLQLAVSAFLGSKSRSQTKADAGALTGALIGALLESNLAELGQAQVELEGATESPAAGTVTLAIGEQQRLLQRFGKKIEGIPQVGPLRDR